MVSLTLLAVCTLASLVGSLLPLVARRVGVDPAVMSAPFITTLVDASGLVVYFLIARACSACDGSRALPVGRLGPALPRLPRHRVGCPDPRSASAVRAAVPRGRPGGPVLDHDPAQARGVSGRVRRLRRRDASPPTPMRTATGCWPMSASFGTGPRSRPSSETRGPGSRSRIPVQLLWSFVGGAPVQNRWQAMDQVPAATDASRAMSKALRGLGFTLRRADHLLRADAVRRSRERPPGLLLPPPAGEGAVNGRGWHAACWSTRHIRAGA